MNFLSKWKSSLCAIGSVSGYVAAFSRVFAEWKLVACSLTAVLALEAVAFFGGGAIATLAMPLMMVSKLGGFIVMLWLMGSVLRAFDTKKQPLGHYVQKAGLWLVCMMIVTTSVALSLPLILERLDIYIGDLPYSLLYVGSFVMALFSAVIPIWSYTSATLGQSIKRSICFVWAELPGLSLLLAPLWVGSHFFTQFIAKAMLGSPVVLISYAIYSQVATFLGYAMVAYWYQKRSKKAAAPKTSKTA